MIRKIQRRWFEVWGDEEAQNRILKYLLLLFAGVSIAQVIVIGGLAFKRPLIVSVTNDRTLLVETREPDPNLLKQELARAISNYLKTRHNWDWTTIEANSKAASRYVAPEFRERYLISTQEEIRIAHEKQVSQKFFPEEPVIDMKEKAAKVHAERIIIIGGVRAAQGLNFDIGFSLGSRTEVNPEGVFIVSEKLEPVN